jgi:hypothetical protein
VERARNKNGHARRNGRGNVLVTVREDGSHLEITGGQSDDAGLIQLRRNGGRKRQQLRQLEELLVLFDAARSRGVLAFLFHHDFLRAAAGCCEAVDVDRIAVVVVEMMMTMMMAAVLLLLISRAQIQRV